MPIKVICKQCGKTFYNYPSNHRRLCCRKCYDIYASVHPNKGCFQKGHKINLGRKYSEAIRKRMSRAQRSKPQCLKLQNENHHGWKGNNVGYDGLHHWVRSHKPKSDTCEVCGKKKLLQLANKDHKYRRDINDFMWLCVSCHRRYDLENGLTQLNKRSEFGQFVKGTCR